MMRLRDFLSWLSLLVVIAAICFVTYVGTQISRDNKAMDGYTATIDSLSRDIGLLNPCEVDSSVLRFVLWNNTQTQWAVLLTYKNGRVIDSDWQDLGDTVKTYGGR